MLSLNTTGGQLVVSWSPPAAPNGMVLYNVSVSAVNLVNNQPIVIPMSTAGNIDNTIYSVSHTALAYSNYTASVTGITTAGPGPVESVTVQTPQQGKLLLTYLNTTH